MPTSRAAAWRTPDILRAALVVAGVWLALQLLWVARSVFFLAFLGVLFGITLSAGATWLQRRRVPRGIAVFLLVAAFPSGPSPAWARSPRRGSPSSGRNCGISSRTRSTGWSSG
jgi:hypothetical protein